MDTLYTINIVLFFFWMFFHVHLFSRSRGYDFYVNHGFVIIVVTNGCLWFVVHSMVFDVKAQCGGPTGYCGTISCTSGNVFLQG